MIASVLAPTVYDLPWLAADLRRALVSMVVATVVLVVCIAAVSDS